MLGRRLGASAAETYVSHPWTPAFAGVVLGNAESQNSVSSIGARVYPGSEAGTCVHSNRSFRFEPAHQGMKMGALVGRTSLRGSELGSATDLPAAGDKPQPYSVLFRLETKSQLQEVS